MVGEDEAADLPFTDIERHVKAYVMALWRLAPPMRVQPPGPIHEPRRTSFSDGIIRVPDRFRGLHGERGVLLYHAALAHIGAHLTYGGPRFVLGSLKPVQVALVSLIEDARVEHLAMRRYPGLKRLWLPFHDASAGADTAPALMARLARALIDSGYVDDNGWVAKGRRLFFAEPERWGDGGISRAIGGLLGNDLGQMRAQFNAKTYVVEPLYRDDNQGLWDFGDAAASAGDTIYETVRLEAAEEEGPTERERDTPDQQTDGQSARRARIVASEEEVGIPVARYPEWDYMIARDRADWTTILEYEPRPGAELAIERIYERRSTLVRRLETLVRAAKVSRPARLKHQTDGDRLDLDACIDAAIDHRLRRAPDPRLYARLERRFRDLSVLLLLDASESTNDRVPGAGASVLELEREAAALLARALAELGDPFALHAFCSDTRADVRYYRLKEFARPFDGAARRRLAGLSGRFSTRMGAALRHAGRELAGRLTYRRLLLMISDGEPSDVDVPDRRYLVEDARRAVMALSHAGIDVFCIGLDPRGDHYLTRIFGRRNVVQLDRTERLPETLSMLYLRLTE